MDDISKKPHKIEGNQIKYFNGRKWLVRETLKNVKEANDKLVELEAKNNVDNIV